MKVSSLLLPAVISLIFITACSSNEPASIKSQTSAALLTDLQAKKPISFTLIENKRPSINLPKANLTIKLLEVKDSRCPQGTMCIWEGDAAVKLEILDHRADYIKPPTYTLHTNRAVGPRTVDIGDYLVVLRAVTPYPKLNAPPTNKSVHLSLVPLMH
jgi:hypothetical protein